jgi:hypothetical protein
MADESKLYKTSDGKEFAFQEEAIIHEQVQDAYKQYKESLRNLNIAIAGNFKTADDHLFKVGGSAKYYCILGHYSSSPIVSEVSVSKWKFEIDEHDFAKVKVERFDGNKMIEIWCEVGELYQSQEAAYTKLIELLEEKKENLDNHIHHVRENYL